VGTAKNGPRVALASTFPVATIFRSAAFPRVAPFAVFIAFLAAQSLLASLGAIGDSVQDAITLARGLAVAVVLACFWGSYSELRVSPSPLGKGHWLLAILLGLGVFAIWITFDSGWALLEEPGRGFVPLRADGSLDIPSAALRLFALVGVVPVMEELFWRSFLMRWIDARDFASADPRQASLLAFVLCCALFSLEHSLWFAGFVAGAAYGWLYIRSGNLWVPITSHAITNGALGTWILFTGDWRFW
jgi:CAAX prenyl protease-like protein